MEEKQEESPHVPIWLVLMGVLIIIGLVGGVWWTFTQRLIPAGSTRVPAAQILPSPEPGASDDATTALEEQESSDEISAIEADLLETDLSNLDRELTVIEAEFSSP